MFHKQRTWCVRNAEEDSIEWLANQLTNFDWCCCCGFRYRGYLFLNDSFSNDSAKEYAVVREPTAKCKDFLQVESITFGWCNLAEAIANITAIFSRQPSVPRTQGAVVVTTTAQQMLTALGSKSEVKPWIVQPHIESIEEHGHCPLCA